MVLLFHSKLLVKVLGEHSRKNVFLPEIMKQQQNNSLDILFVLCSRSVLAVAVVVCVS